MAALASAAKFGSAVAEWTDNHPDGQVWLDGQIGLVAGIYPQPAVKFDFLVEGFVTYGSAHTPSVSNDTVTASAEPTVVNLAHEAGRLRGIYSLRVGDNLFKVGSLKQALIVGLEAIEDIAPGTMLRMTAEKKRTKRPVSNRPEDLYETPHPASHSHRLKNGFYVATNNNESEVRGVLRQAAAWAGLTSKFYLRR